MEQKLSKPPLVEAILEIRWSLEEVKPGLFVDPNYKILIGRLYDRLEKKFPSHESLPTASMPDEMLAYTVQHQFRVAKRSWPLIQVGPGIVTLNDTQNYSWDNNFEAHAVELIATLFETYPNASETLKITGIHLRYIDAINLDYSNVSVLTFIKDKLKIDLMFPDEFFEGNNIEILPSSINTFFSFPINTPPGTLSLRFATGKNNEKDALIWETAVGSQGSQLPKMPMDFNAWLESAHNLTHNMFFKLIEGELKEQFK